MKKYKKSSNRSFGIVFFVFFLILALYPLINGNTLNIIFLVASLIFFFLGIFNSKYLTPLNYLWIKIGDILGAVIAPIIMFIIYVIAVIPTGIILKILRKDVLKLKINKNIESYWIAKDNKKENSMRNQF